MSLSLDQYIDSHHEELQKQGYEVEQKTHLLSNLIYRNQNQREWPERIKLSVICAKSDFRNWKETDSYYMNTETKEKVTIFALGFFSCYLFMNHFYILLGLGAAYSFSKRT